MGKLCTCSLKNKLHSELCGTDIRAAAVFAALCLILGILSAFVSGSFDAYDELCLPEAAPPAFVFPIIWSVLYLLIGGATGLVVASCDRCLSVQKSRGLVYFFAMLALNLLWSPVFFGGEMYFVAFVIVCAIAALTFFTLLCYSNISVISTFIMLAYLIWVIFAAYLNLAILFLNE